MKKGTFKVKIPFLHKIFKKIMEENGEIEPLIAMFIMFVAIWNIGVWSKPFFEYQNMVRLTEKAVEEAEYTGKVDNELYSLIASNINDLNLSDNNIEYSFEGNIRADGKVQLRDEFTMQTKGTVKVKLSNFSDLFTIEIPIEKKMKGESQNYYRPSEL